MYHSKNLNAQRAATLLTFICIHGVCLLAAMLHARPQGRLRPGQFPLNQPALVRIWWPMGH